jgi:hypothetical protein
MKPMFLKSNAARARDILQTKGIRVLRLQEAFGGGSELTVESDSFTRAKLLLTAAGIQVALTR